MCLHLVCTLNFRFSEHEILREEIKSLQAVRAKLQQRVQELEEEVKVSKEDAEKAAKKEQAAILGKDNSRQKLSFGFKPPI